jgi:membrane protein DedA with SNARE-associated domain
MPIPLVFAATEPTLGAYAALFGVMLLSWAGLPVAGQASLVAAGVLAAHDRLDVVQVLVAAASGSAAGGWLAYWLGRRGGRALWTMRGPFRQRRTDELARGERLVGRHPAVAVFILPTWVAGVCQIAWRPFLFWNVFAALSWTLVAGLGGYWVGPAIGHALGLANTAFVVAMLAAAGFALTQVARRRRRHGSR